MEICSDILHCAHEFQTFISGVLAILAALGTSFMIWKSAFLPIQHQKAHDLKQKRRKQHYVALVLSRNFRLLATRAKQVQGTVITHKAANASVTDKTRERSKLIFDPIIDDWELMSLFPMDLLTDIVDLRKYVADHNFMMDQIGGAFGDDNVGEQIKRRMDSVQNQCSTLSNKLQAFINETKNDHKD